MLALGARYSGVDLIEMATSRNLTKTYNDIYYFCEGQLRAIVGRCLDRYDLQNIKTIVRSKIYGVSAEEVEEDLVPAGSFPIEFLRQLVEAPNLDEVFKRLEETIYAQALAGLGDRPSAVTQWAAWEDRVSRLYYADLLQSVPPSTEANRLMREFIEREIDLVNLKTLLRVWAAKATFDREIFLPGGYETTEDELNEMVRLDKSALMARLSEYSFYPEIAGDLEGVEATGVGALLREVEKIIAAVLDDPEVGILVLDTADMKGLSNSMRRRLETVARPVVIAVGAAEDEDLRTKVKRAIGVDLFK